MINLSLESAVPLPGQLVSGGPDAAVRYAWERGVVVVAAAGNSGTPFTDYAASTPVLLVGATDARGRQTTFSDSGRRDLVLAPGVDIVSTACDRCGRSGTATHASASGTSFAAPHVAGAVAVLLAQGRSPAESVEALRDTAVPVSRPATSLQQGQGRIDLAAAVAQPRMQRRSTSPPSRPSPQPTATPRPAPDHGEPEPDIASPSPSAAVVPETETTTDEDLSAPVTDGDDEDDEVDEVGGPAVDDEPTAPDPTGPADDPPGGTVALPSPRGASTSPVGLVLLAASMILVTGVASLHALGATAAPRR